MELIKLPDKYRTFNGVQREILKRGRKSFLEKQTHNPGSEREWINFIVRERIVRYMNNVMADVEQCDNHQPYSRFKTEKEALKFFELLEGGKASI